MLMNKVKLMSLPVFAVIILLGSYLVSSRRDTRAAVRTDLPAVETAIDFWQDRIAQNPAGYIEYTYLAEAYTRKARESGDVGYYQRAEGVLRQGLEINPKYPQASILLANVLFAMHDFQGALQVVEPFTRNPRTPQILAVYGDIKLALGDYPMARAAYQQLHELLPGPASYSRLAVLADISGNTDRALEAMEKAGELARQYGDYPESLAWYEYQLGELYFKSGQYREAKFHYQSALDIFPDYYLGLAGLGKVAAAGGNLDQAIQHYARAVEVVPQPDLLATLGDLYTLVGNQEEAELQYETVVFIGKLAELNQQVYNRQLALYYADHDLHPERALDLALAELAQRKDIYGYDTAAWAYLKNGQLAEAQAMIEKAMQLGTRDARLYFHAGMIAEARGRIDDASRLLAEALAINPHFDPLQSRVAEETLDRLAGN
jgi:tetratricopeptide (TPR) repeat protein